MNKILSMMDTLEEQYGYVEGDINWSGLLNTALDLRGQTFMMDYFTNPDLVKHLLDVILETIIQTVNLIKRRTKSSSVAVNRIVGVTNPNVNLHSNCSVTMISKETYEEFHLPYEIKLADALRPLMEYITVETICTELQNRIQKPVQFYTMLDGDLMWSYAEENCQMPF